MSVITNLLESTCDWIKILDSHQCVDITYIDLSKAFDSVVHSKLISKLSSFGIQGSLLSWINNYLSDRRQTTAIENYFSTVTPILSGVPQGSVLGPLLFNIFINDLPFYIMEHHGLSSPPLRLFADDIKTYRTVNCLQDALTLQSFLNSISAWCKDSQLKINVQKCFVLHLGPSNNHFVYGFDGVIIPTTELMKDLGVYIEPNLSFSRHIAIMCAKARVRCSLFFKCFISRDIFTMKLFYVTYVRPLLEFASPIWNPLSHSHINAIESVQRYFTNKVPTCTFLPYNRRLDILNLDSLQKRREVADLICIFSILNGSTNTTLYPYLILANPSITRGHDLKIVRPLFNYCSSNQNIISRACQTWNKLPVSILGARTKFVFKKQLLKFCLDPFKS